MKILIVGYGYVGKAVGSVFTKKEKYIVDPKYFRNSIQSYSGIKFDIVFVCVDTPTQDKFKTLNTVLSELDNYIGNKTIVCCKSTASPYFYKKAEQKYKNIIILYSPEYLSHHSNIEDFNAQTFLIFGGEKNASKKASAILRSRLPSVKRIEFTDIETAALIKYAGNGFFAYKITFFNELFNICKKLKIKTSFENVVRLLTLDTRIGCSHTQVPGRDGKRGWGGHCFKKDTLEFQKFSKSKLIAFIRKINKLHRTT